MLSSLLLFQGVSKNEVLERCYTLVHTAEASDWDVEEIFSELSGECEKSVAISGNGEFLAGINGAFLLFYFLKGRKFRKRYLTLTESAVRYSVRC